jgi:tape measure domain-containing protein
VAKKELLLIEIREDGARVVKRNISSVGAAGDKTTGQMNKLQTAIAGLVTARALKGIIMLADSYANMLNRLRVVTEGHWELNAAMNAVVQMSRETRTALEGNIDMYARIALNTKQMGLGMKDVVRFATQLNHAIILSGVTSREAKWGMIQFSQGLAAGALRGDELRAVMEQLPIVTQTLTKYLGIGRGALRKWAFEGRVTTRVIIDAFNAAEKSLADRFGKRIPTVDQAVTVLGNSFTKLVGDLDQAMQGTTQLASALLWMADNMESVVRLLGIVGAVLLSSLIPAVWKLVASLKLLRFEFIALHPLMSIFGVAALTLVAYSDKIKIAKDSTATLADVFTALGEKVKLAYMVMRDGASEVGKEVAVLGGEARSTWQIMLDDAVKFGDDILGVFKGIGAVIRWVFADIPKHGKQLWNELVDTLETQLDLLVAMFNTIGDVFEIMALNLQTGMRNLGASFKALMRGNLEEAARFGDQAALSFANAAKDGFKGFGDILAKNMAEGMKTDMLGGAKFEIVNAGETAASVFATAFNSSGFIAGLFKRAKEIAGAGDAGGPNAPGEEVFSPTPVQNQLIKDMIGDVGKVNNQMLQLKELWDAINSKQAGTEGFTATLDQVNRKMTELKLKAMEVNTDVISGFQRGFLKLGLEISDFASLAEKTITNAFKGMEDALVSFVTTGKVNFKSLVDGMLADLTRLLARQALMGMLQSMANSGGGGAGMLGQIAGAFGVTGDAGAGGVSAAAPKRALGGPVSPGMDYMVGERRAEMFRPAQPGHILPQIQAAQPAQEAPITIINVASEEEALAAMGSSEGQRIIRNEVRKITQ